MGRVEPLWNASGADVRFVPAPAASAEVTIKLGGAPAGSCGWANYGPDDIAGAVALYGGKPHAVRHAHCDAWGPVGAPAGLTAAGDPASSPHVHLRWRDAAAPKALIPGLGGVQFDLSVVLAVDQSRCSTDPQHDGYLLSVAAKPGQAQDVVATSFASLAPGQYCFTAWRQDALGRHSPPDTAQFTVGP